MNLVPVAEFFGKCKNRVKSVFAHRRTKREQIRRLRNLRAIIAAELGIHPKNVVAEHVWIELGRVNLSLTRERLEELFPDTV